MSKSSTATHTPGMWKFLTTGHNEYGEPHFEVYLEGTGFQVAELGYWPQSGPSREEGEANARLIAAAPEMLAALQRVARVLPEASLPGPVRLSIEEALMIRAAIAKAEGRDS